LDQVIHPILFYTLCVLGGAGVWLALPRRRLTPQVAGALVAALASGLTLMFMGKNALEHLPNIYFYVFSFIALGAALRVITHPRPVYAALYFILTVVSTGGLFLVLSAEFMAFALIIVYAGAILITYLFVIMLATQAPEEGEIEVLTEYDTQAREPLAACVVGFLLLAVVTTMVFRGVPSLAVPLPVQPDALLVDMPRKVENVLRTNGLLQEGEVVLTDRTSGKPAIDVETGTILVGVVGEGEPRLITRGQWPEELHISNPENVGFNLLRDHPGTIEIAGVILLMAMLGAVVLSRKQVQLDEEAKQRHASKLAESTGVNVGGLQSPLTTGPHGAGGSGGGGSA